MVRVCWAFAAYMVWTPGVCMCVCRSVWVWPTVCDECECGAKGRFYHGRGHITRACLTSLQTHCLSIRFLSQEEGDPCAVMGGSADGTTQMTLRALSQVHPVPMSLVEGRTRWEADGIWADRRMFTEGSGRVWVGWGLAPLTPCIATSLFHGWQSECQSHGWNSVSASDLWLSAALTNSAASCTSDGP